MFFTKMGIAIAWLLFLTGAICYTVFIIAASTGNLEMVAEAVGDRFVASHGTFVEMIGWGVAFGIAAEISHAIAGRNE